MPPVLLRVCSLGSRSWPVPASADETLTDENETTNRPPPTKPHAAAAPSVAVGGYRVQGAGGGVPSVAGGVQGTGVPSGVGGGGGGGGSSPLGGGRPLTPR